MDQPATVVSVAIKYYKVDLEILLLAVGSVAQSRCCRVVETAQRTSG